MASLPAIQSKTAQIAADNLGRIQNVCPSNFDFESFSTNLIVALNEIKADCDPKSVLVAAFNLAQLQLVPGGTLGHAYLIPRTIKSVKRCCLEIGYRGFLYLAREANWLDMVYAEVVLAGESFRQFVDRNGPQVEHELPIDRVLTNANVRQNCVGAYCLYRSKNGQMSQRVIPRSSIDAVDSQDNVWLSNYYEMARKTAIRRAAKDWHLSSGRLADALALEERMELLKPQNLIGSLTEAFQSAVRANKAFSLHDLEDGEE